MSPSKIATVANSKPGMIRSNVKRESKDTMNEAIAGGFASRGLLVTIICCVIGTGEVPPHFLTAFPAEYISIF